MADPKHPRHYDEAFKRQIVQLYESGKPSGRSAVVARHPQDHRAGLPNARLEASDNRIKVTIRMAYGFHHANSLIALVMLLAAPAIMAQATSRHAVIDIPPFNGIVITCALLKRMDRARSSAG